MATAVGNFELAYQRKKTDSRLEMVRQSAITHRSLDRRCHILKPCTRSVSDTFQSQQATMGQGAVVDEGGAPGICALAKEKGYKTGRQ